MLTRRQLDLLNYFIENQKKEININDLSNLFKIGNRSIINDLHIINNYLKRYSETIKKITSKIFVFTVNSLYLEEIQIDLEKMQQQILFDNISSRIEYILVQLLNTTDYIKSSQLEEDLFISESRISQDLRLVRSILSKYNLRLQSKPYHGIKVIGSEIDKRKLIINENIINSQFQVSRILSTEKENKTKYISQLLTNLLIQYHFKVSDLVYQNLIVHIYNALDRISKGYYLEATPKLEPIYLHAFEIAEQIFHDLEQHYNFNCPLEEIKNLAINLQAKREYDSQDYINKEINQLVLDNLVIIRDKYGIDLTNDLDLRVSLALHTKPLITRMKSGRQLKNIMTYEVKQKNAYAFDIASEYGYQLFKKYDIKLTDDEIAYLTLHFMMSMQAVIGTDKNKKILIVSSQRKTNTILIRMKLQEWFHEYLSIECINVSEYSKQTHKEFSIILTTEKSFLKINPDSVLIDLFPTEKDRNRIELALIGLNGTNEILNFFHPELFYYGDIKDKEEMLKILCRKIEKIHPTNNKLIESVLNHESKVSSYFGNQFAMPHPDSPLTDDTFICVGIPKHQLKWDENEGIKVVFLICIGKKNSKEKALQIWEYLSYLIQNQNQLDKIIQNPTYTNFINIIFEFYSEILGK